MTLMPIMQHLPLTPNSRQELKRFSTMIQRTNFMKHKKMFYIATSIILFQFVVICVLVWQVWHFRKVSSENTNVSTIVGVPPDTPESPSPTTLQGKDNNMDMTDIDAIENPIVVARAKYGKQLAKFKPFENKDKSEILKILAELYPLTDENETYEQHLIAYDTAIFDYSKPEEREQFLLILIQVAEHLWQMEEERKGKDLLANLPDTIKQAEEWMRAAEAAGNWEEAESQRKRISQLKDIQVFESSYPEMQAEAERNRQKHEDFLNKYSAYKPSAEILALIKERGMPASYTEYLELLKAEGLVPRDTPNILIDDIDFTAILPEPSTSSPTEEAVVSPSTPYDPVKSFSSAQTSFRPLRRDLEAKYFDVVISRSFTQQEIEKYFPTPSDRQQLKVRTTEMQQLVVSQVRKLLDNVKGATPAQKRSLASALVTKNFDKDFADSVLSALEKETE